MEALIFVLALVIVVLMLTAQAASEALVGRCARRLPQVLATRMQEEWMAELGFISTRPGKLAFAIALNLRRRHAFAAATDEELMPEYHDRPGSLAAIFGGWKSMLILPTLVFTALGYGVAWRVPDIYESTATIQVVPQQVLPDYIRPAVPVRFDDRLKAIQQQIMSRTRLERIILDFKLYVNERNSGAIMEDIVEQMRGDIVVAPIRGDVFRVGFKSTNPRTAMRTAERLASLFIDESLRDQSILAEGTRQFLESQLESVARSLTEHEQTRARRNATGEPGKGVRDLEYEMLQANYRTLYTKKIDAEISSNLERRRIGETFKILDPARLPTRPISPNRAAFMLVGAFAGAALGGMALAGFFRRPSRALAG